MPLGLGLGLGLTLTGGGGFGGAAASNSAETQQFFDRLATPPSSANALLYANLIDALVSAGIWSTLDWLHVSAAVDEATALTNLVSASFFGSKAGTVGAPTFLQYQGWIGSGTNYISPSYTPSTQAGHWVQNSATLYEYILTTTAVGQPSMYTVSGSSKNAIWPFVSGSGVFYAVNCPVGESANGATFGPANGSHIASRTASNLTTLYRNGTSSHSNANASGALENSPLVYSFNTHRVAIAAAGGGINSTKAAAAHTAFAAYLTGVGAI